MKIELQYFKDIYDEKLAEGAIINDRMEGFREDYLVLHCLLRKYKPRFFMEIGTHTGFGTMIIKNALGENSIVFSMDLPDDESDKSKQHPVSEGKQGVGFECTLQYIPIRWDSLLYDFSSPYCEGYYIDGEHDWAHVYVESSRMFKENPKIIIWHDADIPEVDRGIKDAIKTVMKTGTVYNLFRVIDTRIAYALRKDI